jgi:TatD DNase family protein
LVEPFAGYGLTGVFHCFSGSVVDKQKKSVILVFTSASGGVATFKNGGLDTVIPELDINRLVLETDSPYLAPVPHRGKRNTPEYIPLIANRGSSIKKYTCRRIDAAYLY